MANTNGFVPYELIQHYADHGADFGAATAADYERLADAFWNDPKPVHVQECKRGRGDRVRFDPVTDAYCVIDSGNVIRTFFKPVPCHTVPVPLLAAVRKAGRCHSEPDNMSYFVKRCRKW